MIEFLNPYLSEWIQVVLVSIVGTGITLGVVLKFFAENIIKVLFKSYDFKKSKELEVLKSELIKELEKEKAKLGNKTYISKIRFDAEFQTYRELSSAFFDAMHSISDIIPATEEYLERTCLYSDEKIRDGYYKAFDDFTVAKNTLHKNAPFISAALYDQYSEMVELFPPLIDKYARFYNFKVKENTEFGKITITAEDTEKTLAIHYALMDINEKIREYLSSLEVVD